GDRRRLIAIQRGGPHDKPARRKIRDRALDAGPQVAEFTNEMEWIEVEPDLVALVADRPKDVPGLRPLEPAFVEGMAMHHQEQRRSSGAGERVRDIERPADVAMDVELDESEGRIGRRRIITDVVRASTLGEFRRRQERD